MNLWFQEDMRSTQARHNRESDHLRKKISKLEWENSNLQESNLVLKEQTEHSSRLDQLQRIITENQVTME